MIVEEYLKNLQHLFNVNDKEGLSLYSKQNEYYQTLLEICSYYTEKADKSVVDSYAIINSPRVKECYRNSLLLALTCDDIEYVEGYYVFDEFSLPFEHAWNIKNGKVIDTTANLLKGNVVEYYGVVIPKNILRKYLKTSQVFTALQYYFQKNLIHSLKQKSNETV